MEPGGIITTKKWGQSKLFLTPSPHGMAAEMKTGQRRIIEYLLTPVIKGFKESVRGR